MTSAMALEARARQSLGASSDAIHAMVADAVERLNLVGAGMIDVGCGQGSLRARLVKRFPLYRGLDAVSYTGFPEGGQFTQVDLDADRWPIEPESAELVVSIETIEHLENPWSFMRHLAVLTIPGGSVLVTTPNQLSVLSLLTLATKRRFSAFQDAHYPAHRTALLESDLRRIAAASGLDVIEVAYSLEGRIPLTGAHYPPGIARLWPRGFSDNLLLIARKPHA